MVGTKMFFLIFYSHGFWVSLCAPIRSGTACSASQIRSDGSFLRRDFTKHPLKGGQGRENTALHSGQYLFTTHTNTITIGFVQIEYSKIRLTQLLDI